jgi:hypothetical protein
MGQSGFGWWVGVVEDRASDPLKLGRCRVRVLGAHTEDKTLIPTIDLFYAYVYQPITFNPGMSGLGHSPTGPVEGSWCWGAWRDEGMQEPIILGILAGIPQEAGNPQIGFTDPGLPFHDFPNAPRKIRSRFYPNDGTGAQLEDESSATNYPRTTHPWGCIIGESDTNRLARAEEVDDTIIGVRRRQRDVNIPIAPQHTTGRQWCEPESTYEAAYPYNHVYESESGHVFEVDDTPGAERLHFYHRSGTFVEIQGGTDGDFVLKVVGKRFEVTMEQAYSHYQKHLNVTIDGETNIYCRNDANIQVDGNLNLDVKGDVVERVHGNYFTDIDGDRVVRIGGRDELNVEGDHLVKVGGQEEVDINRDHVLTIGGNEDVNVDGDRVVRIGGDDDLNVGGSRTVKIGDSDTLDVGDNVHWTVGGSTEMDIRASMTMKVSGTVNEISGGPFSIASSSSFSGVAPSAHVGFGFVVPPIIGFPGSPDGPGAPEAPAPPEVPPFPERPDRGTEDRDETGTDPEEETKPDVEPVSE